MSGVAHRRQRAQLAARVGLDNPALWDVKSMPLNGVRLITARRGVITWIVRRDLKAAADVPWEAKKMRGGQVIEELTFRHLPAALRRHAT